MRLVIEPIACDNEAFDADQPGLEVARILHQLETELRQGAGLGTLRDLNGNKVSSWRFEP